MIGIPSFIKILCWGYQAVDKGLGGDWANLEGWDVSKRPNTIKTSGDKT
jgi:hypothetical protein